MRMAEHFVHENDQLLITGDTLFVNMYAIQVTRIVFKRSAFFYFALEHRPEDHLTSSRVTTQLISSSSSSLHAHAYERSVSIRVTDNDG